MLCPRRSTFRANPARIPRRQFATAPHGVEVRTRFAPSPTGMMHIGGLRTALFNYLYAKKHNGQFLLRIEDTDRPRTVEGAEKNIIEMMRWAGIDFDEGPGKDSRGLGPYRQSERTELYQKHVDQLIDSGHAYRCFCTPQRLEEKRKSFKHKGVGSYYDRFCLKLTPDQIKEKLEQSVPFTVRLKIPAGTTEVDDVVAGKVSFNNNFIDDQVLLKSDKFPTYHLANVVDDHYMKISHVIRGDEWLTSAPKHVILYKAFGWRPPVFVHLPLLLNEDKQKLSKRHGDTSVTYYANLGYTPEGLVNFVGLLGWNPGNNDYTEIFSMKDFIDKFSLEHLSNSSAVVSVKKLNWLNMEHMRLMANDDTKRLLDLYLPFLKAKLAELKSINTQLISDEKYIIRILQTVCSQDRFDVLPQLVDKTLVLICEPPYDTAEAKQYLQSLYTPATVPVIQSLIEILKSGITAESVSKEQVAQLIQEATNSAAAHSLKKPELLQTLRYCLTARREGFEIPITIELLGLPETVRRLELALKAAEAVKGSSG